MKLSVHIDRLVLRHIDLPRHHRPMLQNALQRELARLIAADPTALRRITGGTIPSLTAEAVSIPSVIHHAGQARSLGRSIARSVYQRIGL